MWKLRSRLQAYTCRQEKGHLRKERKKPSPFTRVGIIDEKGPYLPHLQKLCQRGMDARESGCCARRRNQPRVAKFGAAVLPGFRIEALVDRGVTRDCGVISNVI